MTSMAWHSASVPWVIAIELGKGLEMRCARCQALDSWVGSYTDIVSGLNLFLATHALCPAPYERPSPPGAQHRR